MNVLKIFFSDKKLGGGALHLVPCLSLKSRAAPDNTAMKIAQLDCSKSTIS